MGTKYSSNDEWIELYNPSSVAINLGGWSLATADGYLNIALSNILLPSGGYYLLAHTSSSTPTPSACVVFKSTDVTVDQTFTGNLLSNYGETLELIDPSGNQIDVAGNSSGWLAGTAYPNYASMERRGLFLGTSSGSWITYADPNAADRTVHDCGGNLVNGTPRHQNWAWGLVPTAIPKTKTPTSPPPTPAPKLAINEFLPRAGHDWNNDGQINVYDEFIEIENVGVINVSLSGWSLSDDPNIGGKSYSLPSQTLKPGQRAVFYGSTTGILLIDSGDSVRLTNPSGLIVDARTYGPVEAADQSYCRIPDGIGYWTHPCFPTPGNENALTGVAPVQPTSIAIEPTPCLLADTVPGPFVRAICDAFGADVWNQNYWNQLAGQSDFPVPDNYSKWQTIVK